MTDSHFLIMNEITEQSVHNTCRVLFITFTIKILKQLTTITLSYQDTSRPKLLINKFCGTELEGHISHCYLENAPDIVFYEITKVAKKASASL